MSESQIRDLVRAISRRLGNDGPAAGPLPEFGNVYLLRGRPNGPAEPPAGLLDSAGRAADGPAEAIGRYFHSGAPERPLPNLRRRLQLVARDGIEGAAIDELVDLLERAEPQLQIVQHWRQKHPVLAGRLFGTA